MEYDSFTFVFGDGNIYITKLIINETKKYNNNPSIIINTKYKQT